MVLTRAIPDPVHVIVSVSMPPLIVSPEAGRVTVRLFAALPLSVEIAILFADILIAPAGATSALPLSEEVPRNVMAPFAMIVPAKLDPSAILTAPLTNQ